MSSRFATVFAALFFFCGHFIHATDETDQSKLEEELKFLAAESYLVTATRSLEEVNKSGASVTIITGDKIRKMGARTLIELLDKVPGIGVTQNHIGQYEIESRGVKTLFSEKVLFMIDSHAVNNSIINGGALWAFDGYPLDNVERVEIIRGPGSALYGANAFLAVINIITREAEEIDGGELSLGWGRFDTRNYDILFGKKIGKFSFAGNVNYFDTDGYSGFLEQDLVLASGKTRQWKEKYDIDLKLGYDDFRLQGKYAEKETGPFIGAANALNDETEQFYREYFLELKHVYDRDKLGIDTRVYHDFFEFDNFWELFPEGFGGGLFPDGMLSRNLIENTKWGAEVMFRYEPNDKHKLIYSVWGEHQKQSGMRIDQNFDPLTGVPIPFQDITGTYPFTKEENRDIYAFFIEDIWDISEKVRWILGVRYDHYNDFGGTLNPRTSLIWEVSEGYFLNFLYGSAFRDPTFGELYNQNNTIVVGNPDLEPETIDTFELGLSGRVTDELSFRLTGFYNDIRDIIVPTAGPGGVNVHDNGGRIKIVGVEAEMTYNFNDDSYLTWNYTYQDTENVDAACTVPDVPKHRGIIMLNWGLPRDTNIYVDLLLKGSTPRAVGDPREEAPGYGLVNMAFTAENLFGGGHWELTTAVRNLLDKEYTDPSPVGTTLSDYPKEGIYYFAGFKFKF